MSPTDKKNRRVAGELAGDKARKSLSRAAEYLVAGKGLRDRVPRLSHTRWSRRQHHRDPIDLLKLSNRDRVPDLVPLRYGRMLRSPFAFLRGGPVLGVCARSAAIRPAAIFDINDFDETLPAPWEWDQGRPGGRSTHDR
jgi:hypothetical protein